MDRIVQKVSVSSNYDLIRKIQTNLLGMKMADPRKFILFPLTEMNVIIGNYEDMSGDCHVHILNYSYIMEVSFVYQ